jgi:ATP/maltotriose-dependent transcriptional regulator MalT
MEPDRDQTAFVLDDFHRVRDPRIMDEAYFEMVLEKYDDLAS